MHFMSTIDIFGLIGASITGETLLALAIYVWILYLKGRKK